MKPRKVLIEIEMTTADEIVNLKKDIWEQFAWGSDKIHRVKVSVKKEKGK